MNENNTNPNLRNPFPYFGSKKKVAPDIWKRFGEPRAYVEPFAGSLAVLLGRPEFPSPVMETVNDADGLLANFWRAVKADPDAVAQHVDHPIVSSEITAHHNMLLAEEAELQQRLEQNTEYFDAKLAGWWAWGMSSALKFCVEGKRPTLRTNRCSLGLHRLNNDQVIEFFHALQARLRRVQIHTGDWQQLTRPRFLAQGNGITAYFLDPPYSKESGRNKRLYRIDDFNVAKSAAEWAIQHGDDPAIRIAFCGLEREHGFPPTWEVFAWKNDGGSEDARDLERIWFSPHCLCPDSELMDSTPKPSPRKLKDSRIAVSNIQISEGRHRKDLGELDALAENIRENGLLQPIGVRPDMTLVFGERRLRACRDLLGWKKISARVVNVKSIAHGEFAENEMRKQYTPSERYAIAETMRGFEHGGDRRSDQARNCGIEPLTTEQAAKTVGFSEDEFYRVGTVIRNGVPELVEAMDSGELSISAAAKLAGAAHDEQEAVLAKPLNEDRWTAAKIEKQLNRVRREAEIAKAESKLLVEPNAGDPIRLFNCRFQSLEAFAALAPNSAQLICTDIPYDGDFIRQIDDLAAFAERVLAPGGVFVSYLGQHKLDEKLAALGRHLTYRWLGTSAWSGDGTPVPCIHGITKSIPIAIYSKDTWAIKGRWVDTFLDSGEEKNWHPWQRPLAEVEKLVDYFSHPGDLVVDPCGGGFTTAVACHRLGRRCVSCDVEKASVVRGQERLEVERLRPQQDQEVNLLGVQEARMPPGERAG